MVFIERKRQSRTQDGAGGEACESLRHGADEDGHAQARTDLQAAGTRSIEEDASQFSTSEYDDLNSPDYFAPIGPRVAPAVPRPEAADDERRPVEAAVGAHQLPAASD